MAPSIIRGGGTLRSLWRVGLATGSRCCSIRHNIHLVKVPLSQEQGDLKTHYAYGWTTRYHSLASMGVEEQEYLGREQSTLASTTAHLQYWILGMLLYRGSPEIAHRFWPCGRAGLFGGSTI